MPRLAPTRTLLNPQFESYKLSFSPSPVLQQVSLPQPVNQARSGLSAIGFQKVASRVRHNHLAVGSDIGVYVAENGTVYSINVDDIVVRVPPFFCFYVILIFVSSFFKDAASPIREIFQLPEFISDPKRTQGEYPGAAHVSSDIWLLSDGHGGAYLVRVPPQNEHGTDSSAQLLTFFEFISDNDGTLPTPFQLHSVSVVDPGNTTAIAIVSTSVPHAQPKDQHLFDIWGLKFSFPDVQQSMEVDSTSLPSSHDKPTRLIPIFRKRGTHIPFHTSYFPAIRSFLFLSGSTYTSIDAPPPSQEFIPTPDEYAPIPQLGDDIAEGSFDLNTSSATSIPPPYSWTQTEDSVTVAFALPGTTPKKTIRVLFGKSTISLSAGDPLLVQPFYNNAPLWDSIDPSSSLWTWERPPPATETDGAVVQQTKAGLLTLHLEKLNQKTRWSSLFAQGFEAAEVPETLDPSELAHIRDMLDKYTSTIKDGGGGGDFFGHGVPSIAQGERDVDVDEAVGRRALCTWVNLDENSASEWPIDDTPATILSLPIPTTSANPPFTLVAKHDIDGPLFALEFSAGPDILPPTWTHIQTYSALSFVLASKQDTRFTYHYQRESSSSSPSSDGVVLAFESGSRSSGSANVYAYHSSKRGDRQTRQSVFQMRPGSGALVGVGVVHSTKQVEEPVLICLCEKEVTLCRNVF